MKTRQKKEVQPPTIGFRHWWEPNSFNTRTGAGVGGHADAFRKCVKPETGEIAYFGLKTEQAWTCERYRAEYRQWLKDGMPEREVIDGTAAPIEKQRQCFRQIASIMGGSSF